METKYTVESLREKIKELESRQLEEGQMVRAQMKETYEQFKPVNILKSVVKDFASTDGLGNDLLNSAAGFTSGIITKNLFTGKSNSPFVKLLGLAIQFGVTAVISRNYGAIKTMFSQLVSSFTEKFIEPKEAETGSDTVI